MTNKISSGKDDKPDGNLEQLVFFSIIDSYKLSIGER
jgi:hypothetical protein